MRSLRETAGENRASGSGSIGLRHGRNLRSLTPSSDLIFVRSSGEANAATRELGARVLPTLDEALACDLDLAVVATPSSAHLQALLPLMHARVPSYIEKPVVASRPDLVATRKAITETAYESVASQVGCNLRHFPSLEKMRRLIREGELGSVVRATFSCGQWLPDWRKTDYRVTYSARQAMGGGVMLDLIHEFDSARWIFGELEAVASVRGTLSGLEIDTEDSAVTLLMTAEGVPISVEVDYVSRLPRRRYEVVGTSGSLVWDFGTRTLILQNANGAHVLEGIEGFDLDATYRRAMSALLRTMKGDDTVPCQPLEDGLASVDLVLEAKEKSRWHRL